MDGSGLTTPRAASWNPLRVDGTALPPGWLLAAKLLACWLFPGTRFLAAGPPFLPFVPFLDAPAFASWLAPATAAVFYVAFACLLFNRAVRTACLAIAGCLLVHILGHRLAYANNAVFLGVFLFLIGLYDARTGLWPLRIQLVLVYFGASLNKALDPDWWNGRYFDTLMIDALGLGWYRSMASSLPAGWLGSSFGALTIATEATIGSTVLAARDGRAGVALMVTFHLAMLAATRGLLSLPFAYASVAVSAPFLYPWLQSFDRRWNGLAVVAAYWALAFFIRLLPRILSWV